MTAVSGTTNMGGMNAPVTQGKKSLGQEDFLRMMVAQVRNQDPMDPKTNGDFLAQLAQFSTNDGINKMQGSMEQLANSLQSNQALQASALVGRKVLVNSNVTKLEKEGDSKLSVDVPVSVTNLTASVYSEAGELLTKIPLGDHQAGMFDFTWNGMNQTGVRMPEGKYIVKVNGVYGGQEVALKTMTAANVDSVSLGQNGEGIKLNVAGIGAVSLNDVKQITA